MDSPVTPRNPRPLYPREHAFVVQFESRPAAGPEGDANAGRAGRVEHVASGRAVRFERGEELLAFVQSVLAALEDPSAAEALP